MTFDLRLALHNAAAFLAVLVTASLPHEALARDGVAGCSVAEADTEKGRVWRYTIELQVPGASNCRAYVSEDRDRKSWNYCWLKGPAQNPVSATCDDPLDDADFVDWKARAVCGDQAFMAYCQREP